MAIPLAMIGGIVGGGLSLVNSFSQVGKQKKLTQLQEEANSRLMDKSYAHQKELYDYTYNKNKPVQQVRNLEEAGLNPALTYGLGGQGGALAGSGGASVSGAMAPNDAENLNSKTNAMGMVLQLAQLRSSIEVNESIANKNNAEANKTKGVDSDIASQTLQKLIAETTNENLKSEYIGLQNEINAIDVEIKGKSKEWQIRHIEYTAKNAAENLISLMRNNEIGNETKESVITEIKAKAIEAILQTELTKAETAQTYSNINLNQAKIKEISETISQNWNKLGIDLKNSNINEFKEVIKSKYPSIQQVGGRLFDNAIEVIWNIGNEIDKMIGNQTIPYKPKIK